MAFCLQAGQHFRAVWPIEKIYAGHPDWDEESLMRISPV
jgi:hypothetical protein